MRARLNCRNTFLSFTSAGIFDLENYNIRRENWSAHFDSENYSVKKETDKEDNIHTYCLRSQMVNMNNFNFIRDGNIDDYVDDSDRTYRDCVFILGMIGKNENSRNYGFLQSLGDSVFSIYRLIYFTVPIR